MSSQECKWLGFSQSKVFEIQLQFTFWYWNAAKCFSGLKAQFILLSCESLLQTQLHTASTMHKCELKEEKFSAKQYLNFNVKVFVYFKAEINKLDARFLFRNEKKNQFLPINMCPPLENSFPLQQVQKFHQHINTTSGITAISVCIALQK